MSTWIMCTCDQCGQVIGAARTRSGGFELFGAHLAFCNGSAR